MSPRLHSITITDFRSLRGTVTVPLDAPVVLIHGYNGAGKTSIMSAIELALTGEVQSMVSTDPNYIAHLPHRDVNFGEIALTTSGVDSNDHSVVNLNVKTDGIQGTPLLNGSTRSFFSERCYLAQATLGRLLDIYQFAKAREDSPLTRYVKDLLGLNRLDALIEGLQSAADIRNIRKLVTEYGDYEDARRKINTKIEDINRSLVLLNEEAGNLLASIRQTLTNLPSMIDNFYSLSGDLAAIESLLATDSEESELINLAGPRREIASLQLQVSSFINTPLAVNLGAAEVEEREAQKALDDWWKVAGNRLETLVGGLRELFPDLPSVALTDPDVAFKTASTRVDFELQRCEELVMQDDVQAARLIELEQAINHRQARIMIIDEQLGHVTTEAEGLSRILAALIPHLHSEDCPVCGRDYKEVSSEPLVVRVSSYVANLTEQADHLQSLGKARSEAIADLAKMEREREAASRLRLTPENRGEQKARISRLIEDKRRLADLADHAQTGTTIIRHKASARQRLVELRNRDLLATDIRTMLMDLCGKLSQPSLEASESVNDALVRLENYVHSREIELSERQHTRREALISLRLLVQQQTKIRNLEQELAEKKAAKRCIETAFNTAEQRRISARNLYRIASETRTSIVRHVFNESLNAIWRDLFVRLAPSEPFIPAFKLPQTTNESTAAQLETVYRMGGAGGSPGTMLSAGNLNTAALTLFLALHLSVEPQLPWLILDDPVQSMDEVHIAQFAALLRTLSKTHGRQILIAVHERTLFDYLALELSPAFEGDQLITVELSRSNDGISMAEPNFLRWELDNVLAA